MIDNIFCITDDDLHQADVSSINTNEGVFSEDVENNNPLIYIEDSQYLRNIRCHPKNLIEVTVLTKFMDVLKFIDLDDMKLVIELMPGERLDVFYFLLKMINKYTIDFCEYVIINFFEEAFINFFQRAFKIENTDISLGTKDAFIDEFLLDMTEFMMKFLTKYFDEIDPGIPHILFDKKVKNISKSMIKFFSKLLRSEYYSFILDFFETVVNEHQNEDSPNKTDTDEYRIFLGIVQNIVDYLNSDFRKKIMDLRIMCKEILNLEIDIAIVLEKIQNIESIDNIIEWKLEVIDCYSDVYYYEDFHNHYHNDQKITCIWEYDNFLFTHERKMTNKNNAFWLENKETTSTYNYQDYSNNTSGFKKNKMENLEKLQINGLCPYSENGTYDLLEIFVISGHVKKHDQLAEMIVDMMDQERNNLDTITGLDEMSLENYFTITSISNDIECDYDMFISKIKTTSFLPSEYSVEFILQLISRLLNIEIEFYDEFMNLIYVNNSKTTDICRQIDISLGGIQMNTNDNSNYSPPIIIFQSHYLQYYLLYRSYYQHDNQNPPTNNKSCIVEV